MKSPWLIAFALLLVASLPAPAQSVPDPAGD